MNRHRRSLYGLLSVLAIVLFYVALLQPSSFLTYDLIIPLDEVMRGTIRQDDPRLIQHIQSSVLLAPSTASYNLSHPKKSQFSENRIERVLDLIFENKNHGTFFEAGAYDGEHFSTTLYLERNRSWSGLLVEAMPENVKQLRYKHRKAWIAPVCLSKDPFPLQVYFTNADTMSSNILPGTGERPYTCLNGSQVLRLSEGKNPEFNQMLNKFQCKEIPQDVIVQCLPLYSLLLASGFTKIDFFSLDVEGTEMQIMQTIPFDKVDIKVFFIDVGQMKEKEKFLDFMEKKGYQVISGLGPYNFTQQLKNDYFFVKEEITKEGVLST